MRRNAPLAAALARPAFTPPGLNAGIGGGLVAYWDAGDLNCWDGSTQIFKNACPNPADGSAQTAYDLRRGDGSSSSTYPTFNGTPGAKTSSEFFSFDGGDWFRLYNGNTTFTNSMHKNNAQFTYIFGRRFAGGSTDDNPIFTNGYDNTGTPNHLFFWSGRRLFQTYTGALVNDWHTDTVDVAGSDYIRGLSYSEGGGNVSFFTRNGAYDPVSAANTFDGTITSPAATNAPVNAGVGAYFNSGSTPIAFMDNTTRLYFMMIWNRALTKAQMDQVYAVTRGRLGL